MLHGRELPIPLTDDHGTLWVDNADGTVTNTQDENDGRADQPWEDVDPRSVVQLHGGACRAMDLATTCAGGSECADAERVALLFVGLGL